MTGKPNILCIVSEDCPPRIGAYGDKVAKSPNLDQLAAEGVIFDIANCTSPVCAPSRFTLLTGRHAESCPRAQHMQTAAHLPESFDTYSTLMRAAGYYCSNNYKTHYNCDVDPTKIWDDSSKTAHWRNRAPGQPFLAVFNAMVTHESCTHKDQPGTTRAEDVSIPSFLPDTPGMREGFVRQYNAITLMDAELGAHLRELKEDGLADDTIVFYFSDHGSAHPRSKRYCYDDGLSVPMIVRVPPKWHHFLPHEPGTRLDTPVSLVDLFPSFLAIAGLEVPDGLQGQAFVGPERVEREYMFGGRDRMGERYDLVRTVRSRRYRYIRNYSPHRIYGQYTAYEWMGPQYQDYEIAHIEGRLNAMQDRFWHRKPAEEFYDLAADPEAIENLVGNAAHEEALETHRNVLDAHMREIHDTGFIPEHSVAETWDASHDPDIYPLEDVLTLAGLAISRDPANIALFVERLSAPSPVLRYWGAQGLLMLAVEGTPPPDGLADIYEAESDVHVRISLAEALGHGSDPEHWVRALAEIVETDADPRVRLLAVNALTYLPYFPSITSDILESQVEGKDMMLRNTSLYLLKKMDGTYTPKNAFFDIGRLDASVQTGKSKT